MCFVSFERFSDVVVQSKQDWAQLVRILTPEAKKTEVPMAARPMVALSVGDSDNLAALGYDALVSGGSLHVDAAVLRVCRTLLQGQARLAYGGVLRPEPSFTALLHDIVVATAMSPSSAAQPPQAPAPTTEPTIDATGEADPATPLECWVARPYEDRFAVKDRAAHVGLVRYNFVGRVASSTAAPAEIARATSDSLSLMRRELAARTRLTFALAGKRWGFDGIMPGVAEEVLCRWERGGNVRLLLMGEYGGVVGEMVRYILEPARPLHESLTLAGQIARDDSRLRILLSIPDVRAQAEARYADLERCLDGLRVIAANETGSLPALGLTVPDWKHIMSTTSIGYVRRLLRNHVLPALRAVPTA